MITKFYIKYFWHLLIADTEGGCLPPPGHLRGKLIALYSSFPAIHSYAWLPPFNLNEPNKFTGTPQFSTTMVFQCDGKSWFSHLYTSASPMTSRVQCAGSVYQLHPLIRLYQLHPLIRFYQQHPLIRLYQLHSFIRLYQQHPLIRFYQQHPLIRLYQLHPLISLHQLHSFIRLYQQHPLIRFYQQHPLIRLYQLHPLIRLYQQHPLIRLYQQHP
jgi:hypothetical protein